MNNQVVRIPFLQDDIIFPGIIQPVERVETTSTIEEDETPRSIPNEHNPSFSDDESVYNH